MVFGLMMMRSPILQMGVLQIADIHTLACCGRRFTAAKNNHQTT